MPKPSDFVNHLLDLLSPIGDVRARSMFGGWGFYHADKMFALVVFETFHVKADDLSRGEFESIGLKPFIYDGAGGKRVVVSYYSVPADALEASPVLCEWARKGIDAAARASAGKRKAKAGVKKARRARI